MPVPAPPSMDLMTPPAPPLPPLPPARPPAPPALVFPALPPAALAPPLPAEASGGGATPESTPPTPASGTGWAQPPLRHTSPGAQSASSWHDVRHDAPSAAHSYGSQLLGDKRTQVAAELHVGAAVTTPLAQKATPHATDTPGSVHTVPLVPSQKPPHAPEPRQPGLPARGMPFTATQVPMLPTWSQAWHSPPHASLQQTPSTQLLLVQCDGEPHVTPFASFATQIPAEQYWLDVQSPSVAQPPLQRVPALSQPTGSQLCCWSGAQEPSPWQNAARSARPALHVPGRHAVVAFAYAQRSATTPSQAPPQTVPSLEQA